MWISKGTSFSISTAATSLMLIPAGGTFATSLLFTRHRKTTGTNHVYIRMNYFLWFFTAFGRIIVIQMCAFCPSCANIITADVSSKKLTRQKNYRCWKKIVKLYLNNLHLFHVRYSTAVYFKKARICRFPSVQNPKDELKWWEDFKDFSALMQRDRCARQQKRREGCTSRCDEF